MRTSFGLYAGLTLAILATPAFAEDTAPPPEVTINGTAAIVSDYRFRGISQSNKRFAVQGSITASHKSGVYGGVWASSIDDYITSNPGSPGSDQEIDLIAGFKKTFGGTTVDVGATYYYYAGHTDFPNTDFIEPYIALSHSIGPVTAKGTIFYAPKQKALALANNNKDDNLYGSIDLSGSIPDTPLGLSAHLGHNFERSFLSLGTKYTDWSLGATYTYKALTFGISYVDTNTKAFSGLPTSRNITKGGVLGTITASF
jgi:uncharacterized protein (TIGR02001 family)